MSARTLVLRLLPRVRRPHTKLALTPVGAITELALTPEGAGSRVTLSCVLQAQLTCVRAWRRFYPSCVCFPSRLHPANRPVRPAGQQSAAEWGPGFRPAPPPSG